MQKATNPETTTTKTPEQKVAQPTFIALGEALAQLRDRGEDMHSVAEELFEAATIYHTFTRASDNDNAYKLRLQTIEAIMGGQDIAQLFLPHTIAPETSRLIEVYVSAEVAKGLELRAYRDKLTNPETREQHIEQLTANFDAIQQQQFAVLFDQLSLETQQLLLARLDGKLPLEYAAAFDMPIKTVRSLRDKITNTLKKMGHTLQTSALPFPQSSHEFRQPPTILAELTEYLTSIDEDCRDLAQRLTQPDRDIIAYSLFTSNLTTQDTVLVLRNFTAPHKFTKPTGLPNISSLHGVALNKKYKAYKPLIKQLKPVTIKRLPRPKSRPPRQQTYEESDEAQRLILGVITAAESRDEQGIKPQLLTYEQEAEFAKRIEAGMWAEVRLALDSGDTPEQKLAIDHLEYLGIDWQSHEFSTITPEDLALLAADGQEALFEFMVTNYKLACKFARARHTNKKMSESQDEITRPGHLSELEKKIAGLEGVLRAIRGFDYTRGNKFSSIAVPWIRQRVQRHRYETYPGLPAATVQSWERLRYNYHQLKQQHGEPVTLEQLSEATGITVKLIQRTITQMQPFATLDEGFLGGQTGIEAIAARPQNSTAESFTPTSTALFAEVFAGDPTIIAILRLRFEQEYEIESIASQLKLTTEAVATQLAFALDTLHGYLGGNE